MKKLVLSVALTLVFALTLTSFNNVSNTKQNNPVKISKQITKTTCDFGDEYCPDLDW